MYQYNFAHFMAQPKDVKDLLKVFAQPVFGSRGHFFIPHSSQGIEDRKKIRHIRISPKGGRFLLFKF